MAVSDSRCSHTWTDYHPFGETDYRCSIRAEEGKDLCRAHREERERNEKSEIIAREIEEKRRIAAELMQLFQETGDDSILTILKELATVHDTYEYTGACFSTCAACRAQRILKRLSAIGVK